MQKESIDSQSGARNTTEAPFASEVFAATFISGNVDASKTPDEAAMASLKRGKSRFDFCCTGAHTRSIIRPKVDMARWGE